MRFWLELARAVALMPRVEWWRRSAGTRPAVEAARRLGSSRIMRDQSERDHLRRVIAIVDGLLPLTEPNCFRRVLLEIALDGGAAHEIVHVGLPAHGTPRSGHVWLAGERSARSYDAVIAV